MNERGDLMTMRTKITTMLLIGLMAGAVSAQTTNLTGAKVGAITEIYRAKAGGGQLEKATYLGIASTSVPAALREQLKLKKSVGLVVERVERGSPAEQAGVKQYDIVEKLDDQWLINAEQFAGLVRMQEPGAKVTLSIIRQGQPQTVTATLVEKELPVAVGTSLLIGDPFGKVFIESPKVNFKFDGPIDPLTRSPRQMIITSAVGQNVLTITRDGDNTRLYAKDVAGNELFNGPVDTEEQWKEVPPDIAAEARRLISGMRLNISVPKATTLDKLLPDRRVPVTPQPPEPTKAPPPAPALP